MSPEMHRLDGRLTVGLSQLITASILVHMDGRARYIQHDSTTGAWTIADRIYDPTQVAFEVTQNDVIVHLQG